ncbi:hypothetical protein B9Z19DRAFT_988018 [Tuber borchii]|uniref:Uncharacterized protein n=1 Tax=Tuber borchii TaxID=42251 RepID=A0A2T6ZNR9_TUBBO|nr:hypothetical protein B9Z19DRAFT_988018 [Tuber borchii]
MTLKNLLIIIHLDLLLPLAVFLNLYLYFYPVFHFCAFTSQPDGTAAPFRLLALADPQLEGDSTLLKYKTAQPGTPPSSSTSSSLWDYIHPTDISLTIRGLGKVLDLWGNDLYLRHVFRTTRQMLAPTHTVVLGDLLGSQWISDEEFKIRGERFWRIFGGKEDGEGKVRSEDVQRYAGNIAAHEEAREVWRKKVIIVPGNHDIGYAGDMDWARIARFEEMFGVVNYFVDFSPNVSTTATTKEEEQPTLRLIILNSLPLDSPILHSTIQDASYTLLDQALESSKSPSPRQSSLLLTHLPLHKPAGLCADEPLITYYPAHHGGGIKEQNHLSESTSELLLHRTFGLPTTTSGSDENAKKAKKERGMILTGHDHVGCDVRHSWLETTGGWNQSSWEDWQQSLLEKNAEAREEGIREVTVRSMMGEFAGNAGLVSAWFDFESDSWKFEYQTCKLGIQHVWWTVHIIDAIVAITGTILFIAYKRDEVRNAEQAARVQGYIDATKKDE